DGLYLSLTARPDATLTINCKVSYSVTSYATGWIRQPAGKALEWIGVIWSDGDLYYKDSLKSKFSISRDTSSNTITLQGKNMQAEDTAVYYSSLYKNTIIISQIKSIFDDFPHSDL
uniref:Immunoglobulin V-set domain-containing protein n=1 Tax=Sinocyclocheilus grahami TaxID=75366 RepID=A0A672KW55_SINGR